MYCCLCPVSLRRVRITHTYIYFFFYLAGIICTFHVYRYENITANSLRHVTKRNKFWHFPPVHDEWFVRLRLFKCFVKKKKMFVLFIFTYYIPAREYFDLLSVYHCHFTADKHNFSCLGIPDVTYFTRLSRISVKHPGIQTNIGNFTFVRYFKTPLFSYTSHNFINVKAGPFPLFLIFNR